MIIKQLKLKNFRNLSDIDTSFNDKINVIVGPNASGKTNFCESLYYSSCGQLLKGDRQREVIGWDGPHTLIEIKLDTDDQIKIYLNREKREKITQLNKKNCSPGEIYQKLHLLLFTPDNLQILKGSPQGRRKFFNQKISHLDANFSNHLKRYHSVVGKKNASLKKENIDPHLLEVFNQKIAQYGSQIIAKRLKYMEAINEHLSDIYCKFSTNLDHLEIRYSKHRYRGKNAHKIRELISHAIQAKSQQERKRGYCLVGPHRDDILFLLNNKDLRKYGSFGEHKLSIIAHKLAHLELYHAKFKDYPVLIMDDIMGELDFGNREKLLKNLPSGIQIFLTYTELVKPLPSLEGDFYRLDRGKITRINPGK